LCLVSRSVLSLNRKTVLIAISAMRNDTVANSMMMTLGRVLVSGSTAALCAAAVLAAASKLEGTSPAAPLNATSHWLHGDKAAAEKRVDIAHTGVGFVTHYSAAMLWASLFETLRRYSNRRRLADIARDAALASATAAIVDYVFTPRRLTPGWELVLSKRSMALAYIGMAAGFLASESLLPQRTFAT
jgi:hypothetical protein